MRVSLSIPICGALIWLLLLPGARSEVATGLSHSSGLPSLGNATVEQILALVVTNAAFEPDNDILFKRLYESRRTKSQIEFNSKGKEVDRKESDILHTPPDNALPPGLVLYPDQLSPRSRMALMNSGTVNSGGVSRSESEVALLINGHAGDEEADQARAELEALLKSGSDAKGRAFEKREFIVDADLLNRFQFRLLGEETHIGRPCWLLSFKPKGGRQPVRNFKDRFINKVGGRIWVDVEDGFVVKLDVALTETVDIVGGVVGSLKNCTYAFERERTREGLWYTRTVDWRVEGRQVFSTKVIDYHEERLDVRSVQDR
jgi:hypothetical protein